MDFAKILEKATNKELEKLFYTVLFMDFVGKWDCFAISITNAFTSEIKKRLNNGTMESRHSDFPSDWDLFVNCCEG